MPAGARTRTREAWISALFLAVATLFFLGPALARFETHSYTSADLSQTYSLTTADARLRPGNAHLSDPVVEMLPWLAFNESELRAGRLPTWNPWNGAGVPHLANAQSAVFSPFSLPFYVAPLKWALLASAFLKLFALGFFTFLFLRALGSSAVAACAGAVIFEFGGHNVLLLAYPHPAVAAMLPAALWIIERVWQVTLTSESTAQRTLPWACGLALVFATAIFAGSPETCAFVVAASALYALLRAVLFVRENPARGKDCAAALCWLATAGLLGLAVAAVQVLPFLEYAARSTLIEARGEGFDGLRTANWPLQFFPDLLGNPSQRYSPRPDLPYPNYEAANTSYFGPLTWLMALAGALFARRRFLALAFAAATLLWVAMAFDFDFLRPAMIAFTSLTHAPMNRSQFVPLLALAVLAAFGLDALRPSEKRARWAAFAGLCAVAAVAIWLAHRGAAQLVDASWPNGAPSGQAVRVPPHLRFVTWTFCLGALTFAALALARASWLRRVLALGVVAALFAQSGWLLRGFNPLSKDEHVFPRTDAIATIAAATGRERLQVIGEDTLPPQTNMMYGIADIAVYDALNVAAYDELYQALLDSHGNWRESAWTTDHALKTLGIGFVLARDAWPRLNPGIPLDADAPMPVPRELVLAAAAEPIQTFRVAKAGLDRVDVALGARDDPVPAFLDLVLEDDATGELVASRRIDTHSLRAGMSTRPLSLFAHDLRFSAPTAWVTLAFAPRDDSAGKTYRLRSSAVPGEWKNGFLAWTVDEPAREDRALRVGDVVQPGRLCFDWSTNVSRTLEVVATIPPFTLYRVAASRGRFWTVGATRAAQDGESALALTLAEDHDPYASAVVEGVGLLESAASAQESADPPPEIVEESSRRVVLRVVTAKDAWLVAALTWYPGWSASVDGRPVPLSKTNAAFLGLPLTSGEHEVVLEFDSESVQIGAWISCAGLVTLAGLLALRRLRRPRARQGT
ncbi:MAG TPA: YfhO family protein [Planctomycetota bacterium]|nr:YfhO family protein [Planctomycetota bacterium]